MSENRARWISASDAAKLLGVNSRAVQKRAARGTIAARKAGNHWEIDVDAVDASIGAKVDVVDASNGRIADAMDASDVQSVDVMDASIVDALDAVADGERVADLRDEVKFLRGVIEQLQRDGAETRSALRAALKLAGAASAPMLTAGDAVTNAPETPGREQSGTADNDSHGDATASNSGSGARERPLTIGDIADELERNLNQ